MKIEFYTDGACSGKKIGGWAYVMICTRGKQQPIFRAFRDAAPNMTNQRAELLAVLSALRSLTKPGTKVTIYSDAAYVVNCFEQAWYAKWETNGYTNSQGEPVANQDLWKELIPLYHKHDVTFVKVKGHSGVKFNEESDRLAKQAVRDYMEQIDLEERIAAGETHLNGRYKNRDDGRYLGEAYDPKEEYYSLLI